MDGLDHAHCPSLLKLWRMRERSYHFTPVHPSRVPYRYSHTRFAEKTGILSAFPSCSHTVLNLCFRWDMKLESFPLAFFKETLRLWYPRVLIFLTFKVHTFIGGLKVGWCLFIFFVLCFSPCWFIGLGQVCTGTNCNLSRLVGPHCAFYAIQGNKGLFHD